MVKKSSSFNSIFETYFEKKPLKIIDFIDKTTDNVDNYYKNHQIWKIHIKEGVSDEKVLFELFKEVIVFTGENHETWSEGNDEKYIQGLTRFIHYIDADKKEKLEDLEEGKYIEERTIGKRVPFPVDKGLENMSGLREVGELILHFFIKHLLNADLVLSKMNLKSNPQMPVNGCDGIHLSEDEGFLLFGEAKINVNIANSKKQSRESIEEFVTGSKHGKSPNDELSIISRGLDKLNVSSEIISKFNPYFNSKKKPIKDLPYMLTCLLAYKEDDLIDYIKDKDKKKYEKSVNNRIKGVLKYYKGKSKELEEKEIIFFLLPLETYFDLLKLHGLKLRKKTNEI